MAKNNKTKYLWIPLTGLILTALIVCVPWLYGAGKTQATLTATDIALAKADAEIIKDVEDLEEDVEVLENKFDAYHLEQKEANNEILRRLPK